MTLRFGFEFTVSNFGGEVSSPPHPAIPTNSTASRIRITSLQARTVIPVSPGQEIAVVVRIRWRDIVFWPIGLPSLWSNCEPLALSPHRKRSRQPLSKLAIFSNSSEIRDKLVLCLVGWLQTRKTGPRGSQVVLPGRTLKGP